MNKQILKIKVLAYPWVMKLKENAIVLLNWTKKNYKKITINRQYKILQKGIVVWNNWRKENPDIKIDLTEIDFGGYYPIRVPLDEADFNGANLHKAGLQRAMLEKADFSGAILTDAMLWQSELYKADFIGTNLQNANLEESRFKGANLTGADLRSANLRYANLTKTKLMTPNLKVLTWMPFLMKPIYQVSISKELILNRLVSYKLIWQR